MKKVQKIFLSIAIVVARLSYGIAQATADSQFSCLLGQEFEAKIQGLTGSISQKFFMLRGCNQQLHIFTKTKASTQDSTIEFQSSINKKLCDEADGSFLGDRIEASTKFKVIEGEQQRVHLLDQNDQLMVVLVHQPKLRTPHIDTATLNGDYNLFFPSINLYFPGPGRVVIEACNMVSGIYRLSDNGTLAFEGVRKFGSCESKYHNYVVDAISNSTFLNRTDESECEFAFVRSQNQLDIVIAPVSPAQAPTISGNYYLYSNDSALRPIIVIVTDDKFSFRGCSQIAFTYTTADFNSIQFDNFSVTPGFCTVNNDQKYIDNFKQVDRLEFDKDTGKLRLFEGRSQVPIFSTVQQDYQTITFLTGNYSFAIPGLGYEPMKVTFTEDSTEILRLVLHGCNRIQISWVKQQSQLSSFGSLAQSDRYCDPDRDEDFSDRLRQTVRLDYDQNTKQLKLMDSLNSVVLVGTSYEEPIETPSESSLRGQRTFSFPRSNLKPIQIQILNDNNQFLMFSFMGCNRWNVTLTKGNSDSVSFSRATQTRVINSCPLNQDSEYITLFKQITMINFDSKMSTIVMYNQRGELIGISEQKVGPSLAGSYILFLVGSTMKPITVTATDYRFKIHGCNQLDFMYNATDYNVINFFNLVSSTRKCPNSDDKQHVWHLKRVVSFEFNPSTRILKFFGRFSHQIYSTVMQDYIKKRPRQQFAGQYEFTFPGLDSDTVQATASEDNQSISFILQGCNIYNLIYTKISTNSVELTTINPQNTKYCEPDHDELYVEKLQEVAMLALNINGSQVHFIDKKGDNVAVVKSSKKINRPQYMSLSIASFNFTPPGSILSPIQATITEGNQFVKFQLHGCKIINLTFTKNDTNISFTKLETSAASKSCTTDYDTLYSRSFKQAAKMAFNGMNQEIVLQNSLNTAILTTKEEVRPSLAGRYTLYLVGSNLQPITVTATANSFSFQGCTNPYLRYIASSSTLIAFTNFTSSQNQCSVTYDSEYVKKFGEVVRFQFDRNTNVLRFQDQSSQVIYSTAQQDYLNAKPKPVLAREYKLYAVGSNLQPLTVTVTDDEFIFSGCNINNFDYTLTSSGSIQFSSFSSTRKFCEIDQDIEYINKFKQVSNYQLNPDLLKLYSRNSTVIYSTVSQDYFQAKPLYQNYYKYVFYFIGTDLNPIQVTVIENNRQVIFSFKNCNMFQLTFNKENYPNVTFDSSSLIQQECRPNRDNEYIMKFEEILKSNFNPDTMSMKLLNSTKYLFVRNQDGSHSIMKPELIGKYLLYRPNMYFDSVIVTAEQSNRFIHFTFQGCNSHTVVFAKSSSNRVSFEGVNSPSTTYKCPIENDQDYITLFKETARIFLIQNIRELSLESEAGNIIFTTDKSVQPFLVGSFILYSPKLDSINVTVIEKESSIEIIFTGCNTYNITYNKRDMLQVLYPTVETTDNGKLCSTSSDERYIIEFRSVNRITASLIDRQINLYEMIGAVVFTTNEPQQSVVNRR